MRHFKKLILVLLTMMVIQNLTAQTTVKGALKDNKGKPVAGASISIKDSYDGATSDSAGNYSFKSMEKGSQLLLISYIGFKPVEQIMQLEGGVVTVNASMKEEISELTAVTRSAGTF